MPFVVSQLPQVLHLSSDGQDLTILIALIVSVILTIAYFFYEVTGQDENFDSVDSLLYSKLLYIVNYYMLILSNLQLLVQFYCEPLIQTSRINYVEHKQVMSGLLIYLDSCAPEELLTSNGEPNKDVLERLVI